MRISFIAKFRIYDCILTCDFALLTEKMRKYFEQFGEVTHCTIMHDPQTGRSRGFGFLTFANASSVNSVMVKEHYLDGKIVSLTECHNPSQILELITYISKL